MTEPREGRTGRTDVLHRLLARINQFLQAYGGKPVSSNSPRSLDVISDYLLVIDCELDLRIKTREEEPGEP